MKTTAMSASHCLSSVAFFLLLCASHIRAKNAVIDILTQQWMMLGASAAYCMSNEKITIDQYLRAGYHYKYLSVAKVAANANFFKGTFDDIGLIQLI
jgi:hypothetical protein